MSIAITGEGIISAIGCTKGEVLHSLREKRTGIGTMRHLKSVHTELPVGEVRRSNGELKEVLGLPVEKDVSRTALLAIHAIREALGDARLDQARQDDKRIVLITGTTVGGMDLTELHFNTDSTAELAEFMRQHDCGSCNEVVRRYFKDFFTTATSISTACSSAANALIVGAEMLKAGEADIVVAGGTEALSLFHLNGFNALMILDHELCRPFDADRAGLNLGEGAAYMVLERADAARERGADIHALLSGYGNACDAFHQTASSANGEGAYRAMQEALDMAGLKPADIQYINAHGTGTPNNDQSESAALKRVFGENTLPPVSSTKSFTGHTTSASGSIEAVICLLAMTHGLIPANLGFQTPMPDGIRPSLGEEGVTLRHTLCNSFGFGGNDSALIFSEKELIVKEEGTNHTGLKIKIIGQSEITKEEELAEIRQYVKPLEVRRMGRLMKASLLTSLKALEEAGIGVPDAIVTGTAYGCIDNSEHILRDMTTGGENTVSPTLFMQSTHNTLSSNIAIRLGCKGYNITYSQGDDSLKWALADAHRLLRSGRCRNVLVGCHDETTPLFRELMAHIGHGELPAIHAIALVLTADTETD